MGGDPCIPDREKGYAKVSRTWQVLGSTCGCVFFAVRGHKARQWEMR